ncbi:MAG: SurA N-terminal domain-containing protein [Verrucomicrobiales bacterium]
MLHLLRKHQYGILLVVAVLVIVAFAFWDPSVRGGREGLREGQSLKILDTTFPSEEVDEIRGTFEVFKLLIDSSGNPMARYGDPMFQHLITMASLDQQVVKMDQDEREVPMDFVINTALVRHQCKKLGIGASEAECDKRIQTLPRFQKEGKFDPAVWDSFKNAYGGSAGARMRMVYEAIGDAIKFEKLFALIGHPVPPSKAQVDWSYAGQYQKITAHTISFSKNNFENQEVTEDEIKKYYDEHKEAPELQSDERRSIHYVLLAKPTDEQLKELNEQQKEEKRKEYKRTAKEFADGLAEEERKPFTEIAKELKVEVKTTPLFPKSSPPEELKDEPELLDAVFELVEVGQAELSSEGKKGYYAIELAALEKPQPLDFEAAKEKISKLLKEKKQTEKFTEAVSAARDKLKAELEAGRTIVEAAKAAGVEARELPQFSQSKPLKDEPNYRQILSAAGSLDPGSLSEPLNTAEGQILVYVAKKELPKDPKMEDQKKMIASRLAMSSQQAQTNPIFLAWFSDLKKRAVTAMGQG